MIDFNSEDTKGKLVLIPFIAEAFGTNTQIHKDIDKLYQTHKLEFYQLAKESKYYNHTLLCDRSLIQEEYAKKCLGILLYGINFPDDTEHIDNTLTLVKKGWKYIFDYIYKRSSIDFDDLYKSYFRKNKHRKDISDDEVNGSLAIALFLANTFQKNIINNEGYNFITNLFYKRLLFSENEEYKFSLNIANANLLEKVKILKQIIFKELGEVKNYDTMLKYTQNKKEHHVASLIFDCEDISSSILWELPFAQKDVDEIIALYAIKLDIGNDKFVENGTDFIITPKPLDAESLNKDDLIQFYLSSMYTKYLLKAYKLCKQHYFKNNKETMFIEVDTLDKQLKKALAEVKLRDNSINIYQQTIDKQEREIQKLKASLELEQKKNTELHSLREFIFKLDSSDNDYIDESKEAPCHDQLKLLKGIIVGGHERWQSKLKELLPQFIFLHPDKSFDVSIFNNVDKVYIYTDYLNHAMYYKVMDIIRDRDIKLKYLKSQNEKLVLMDILSV